MTGIAQYSLVIIALQEYCQITNSLNIHATNLSSIYDSAWYVSSAK